MHPPSGYDTSSGGSSFPELTSAADFAAVASPGGRVSVVGFGSLLSERSAFPDLKGFRVAMLRGFRRVFANAAPIFERGIAIEATKTYIPTRHIVASSILHPNAPRSGLVNMVRRPSTSSERGRGWRLKVGVISKVGVRRRVAVGARSRFKKGGKALLLHRR